MIAVVLLFLCIFDDSLPTPVQSGGWTYNITAYLHTCFQSACEVLKDHMEKNGTNFYIIRAQYGACRAVCMTHATIAKKERLVNDCQSQRGQWKLVTEEKCVLPVHKYYEDDYLTYDEQVKLGV